METLESVYWNVCYVSVEFVGAVFVLVSLSVKSDSDTVLDVSDTVFPNSFVQSRVDSNILKIRVIYKKIFVGNSMSWAKKIIFLE